MVEFDSRRVRPGSVFLALARTGAERAGHIIAARGAGALGARTGTIGTIGITLDGQVLDVQRRTPTTPESVDLQALLRQFADAGATHVVMEASSIALAGRRVDGTAVSIAVLPT